MDEEVIILTLETMKIVLRNGWIKWGGEGVGWYVDNEDELKEMGILPKYDGSDMQEIELIFIIPKKVKSNEDV